MSRDIDLRVSDVVLDCAQAAPMQVVATPDATVAELSTKDRDLATKYGNARFDPDPAEPVVECVYCEDLTSEPARRYPTPVSRVRRIEVEKADGGRRIPDRVAVDVLARLFAAAPGRRASVRFAALGAGYDQALVTDALARADGGEGDGE